MSSFVCTVCAGDGADVVSFDPAGLPLTEPVRFVILLDGGPLVVKIGDDVRVKARVPKPTVDLGRWISDSTALDDPVEHSHLADGELLSRPLFPGLRFYPFGLPPSAMSTPLVTVRAEMNGAASDPHAFFGDGSTLCWHERCCAFQSQTSLKMSVPFLRQSDARVVCTLNGSTVAMQRVALGSTDASCWRSSHRDLPAAQAPFFRAARVQLLLLRGDICGLSIVFD